MRPMTPQAYSIVQSEKGVLRHDYLVFQQIMSFAKKNSQFCLSPYIACTLPSPTQASIVSWGKSIPYFQCEAIPNISLILRQYPPHSGIPHLKDKFFHLPHLLNIIYTSAGVQREHPSNKGVTLTQEGR